MYVVATQFDITEKQAEKFCCNPQGPVIQQIPGFTPNADHAQWLIDNGEYDGLGWAKVLATDSQEFTDMFVERVALREEQK